MVKKTLKAVCLDSGKVTKLTEELESSNLLATSREAALIVSSSDLASESLQLLRFSSSAEYTRCRIFAALGCVLLIILRR